MVERPPWHTRKGLFHGVAWLGGASLAVKPLWFLFLTAVCARVLGAEGYGVFSTALSLVALTFAFTDVGTGAYTVREVARRRELSSTFISTFGILRGGLLLVAATAALGAGTLLGYDRALLLAVGVACVYQAALGLTEYARAFFQAHEVLQVQAATVVAEKALVIALGATLLVATGSALGTIGGMAVGMVIVAFGTVGWVGRRLAPVRLASVDRVFLRASLPTLLPFGMATLLSMVFFRADTVMVEALLGLEAAGQYGLSFRIVEAMNIVPAIVVDAALYPRLSRLLHSGDRAAGRRLVGRAALGMLGIGVAGAALVSLVARPLIGWMVVDPALLAAGPALAVLCWAFPLTGLRALAHVTLLALDRQRFTVVALAGGVAFNVALNLMLIPRYGIGGAVLATLASEVVLLSVYAPHVWRQLRSR